MVYILTEPNYSNSVWCKNFLNSLIEALRKHRIPFCEVFDIVPNDAETVFLIAADYRWTKKTIKKLNLSNISPILICNHLEPLAGCKYNCVSSDVYTSVRTLFEKIVSAGKKNIALYGVNTRSLADIGKVDTLFSYKDETLFDVKVYNNNGSLKECYKTFEKDKGKIDAVICTNDFVAISLVRNLNAEDLKRITVYSLADSALSKYYREFITSVNIDYNQYGRAALFLYKSLKKHAYLSNISVNLAWDVEVKSEISESVKIDSADISDTFYEDSEVNEMMTVERILSVCDSVDRIILKGLVEKKTIEEINEQAFMSENAVKYRIKKILTDCNIEDKAELVKLLKKYLPIFK